MQADELNQSEVWLVGDKCSLADLSYLTWSRTAHRLGIDLEAEFPEVHSWGKSPNFRLAYITDILHSGEYDETSRSY